MLKRFYLLAAVIGAIAPWRFFFRFFAAEGLDANLFVQSLFVNQAAAGISADLFVSATVFLIWSFADSRRLRLARWWLTPIATLLVGMSLALPLYLYIRTDHSEKPTAHPSP